MVTVTNPISSTSASTSPAIDISDPLYVHNSDIPAIPLVSTLFNGTGYNGWRRNILMALSGRNKVAFINGECPKPATRSPLVRQWERCNDIVTSWILNSMTKEISDSVMVCNSAREVWKDIEERFGGANGVKILELKRQLAFASQGSLDIATYFTKIKSIWDELSLVSSGHSITCTCGAQSQFQKEMDVQKLYQFLMGLNETYIGVRSNILMMSPLPSVGTAYNILISDEQQRQMQSGPQMLPESASFNAAASSSYRSNQKSYPQRVNFENQKPTNPRNNYNKQSVICQFCKITGHHIDNCFKKKKVTPCNHCGILGHDEEHCYKKNGYPADHKSSRNRKGAAHAAGQLNASDCTSSQPTFDSDQSIAPIITREQYNQLINLLQHTNMSSNSFHPEHLASANFAGLLLLPERVVLCLGLSRC